MIKFSLPTLASVIVALACVGTVPALARAPKDDMVRCQQLFGIWSKHNGTSSYSKQINADMALEDCRKGRYEAGIAQLNTLLGRMGVSVPPVETASPR